MSVLELVGGEVLVVKETPATVTVVDKRMVAEVSNENEDSSLDIIWQGKNKRGAGWVLDGFNKNPILTWSHDRYRPNIGAPQVRAKVIKSDDGRRILTLDPFAFDMPDPFAAEIAGKYERGVLRQTSVGFTSSNWEARDNGGREYFEQKLLEVAAVNIGDNQTTKVMEKVLLGHGLAAKIESGGDSEVEFLKDLITQLQDELLTTQQELRAVANIVKSRGDFAGNETAVIVPSTASKAASYELDAAATAILLRMKALGLSQ